MFIDVMAGIRFLGIAQNVFPSVPRFALGAHFASYSLLLGILYERIEELAVKLTAPFHLMQGFRVGGDLRLCTLMFSRREKAYIYLTLARCIVQN